MTSFMKCPPGQRLLIAHITSAKREVPSGRGPGPLTLKVPDKILLYGLYVYYVVHICDFGMLRVKRALEVVWQRRPSMKVQHVAWPSESHIKHSAKAPYQGGFGKLFIFRLF